MKYKHAVVRKTGTLKGHSGRSNAALQLRMYGTPLEAEQRQETIPVFRVGRPRNSSNYTVQLTDEGKSEKERTKRNHTELLNQGTIREWLSFNVLFTMTIKSST